MKKILLTALSAVFLFSSCSQEDMSDVQQQDFDEAISQFTKEYNIKVLGHGFENKIKDEITPSQTSETFASEKFIDFLKDSLEHTFTKTSVKQTKSTFSDGWVGVLKHSTCGSYREFHYYQDNEDGGWTNTRNTGATNADGNQNMNWFFCLVPGHVRGDASNPNYDPKSQMPYYYGGGVLLLYKYNWNKGHGDVDVVTRYHDDEDHSNTNQVRNAGSLIQDNGYIGECLFGRDTGLAWRFSDRAISYSLPFRYGVITNEFNNGYNGSIEIDDENGSNANYCLFYRHNAGTGKTEFRQLYGGNERFRGIGMWNGNTTYYVRFYN